MAYIRVVYKTRKSVFDYVDTNLLDTLISQDEISHFYRSSEKRWVSTRFDAVREERKDWYQGAERRRKQSFLGSEAQEQEKAISNTEKGCPNWLEGLWKHIETS